MALKRKRHSLVYLRGGRGNPPSLFLPLLQGGGCRGGPVFLALWQERARDGAASHAPMGAGLVGRYVHERTPCVTMSAHASVAVVRTPIRIKVNVPQLRKPYNENLTA